MRQAETLSNLFDTDVIVLSEAQISTELEDEVIILNFGDGKYYGLAAVGARVWELLAEPKSLGALRDVLMQEFEVDAETCTCELKQLLQELESIGLVRIEHETLVEQVA